MPTFPTAKVHRTDRRKLGRGQQIQLPPATAEVTSAASHVTLTFNVPVVINGSLDLGLETVDYVDQEQISATVYQVNYSGPVTGLDYEGIPAGSPVVRTMQGGSFAGIPAGTLS